MKNTHRFLLIGFALVASAEGAIAQDAAAPMRLTSPPPSATASPTPKRKLTPTPTPSLSPAQTSTPPAQTPAPTAEERTSGDESTPAAKPFRERRVLREKPVRAVEPVKPFARPTATPRRERADPAREIRSAREKKRRETATRAPSKWRFPFIRRAPAPPKKGRRAFRPTFDLSDTNWTTAATIRSLENRWQDAVEKHDEAALGELLSGDFEGTLSDGRRMTRADMLKEVRQDKNDYSSARASGMLVRSVGTTTAIVTGNSSLGGRDEFGKPFRRSYQFRDRWRLEGKRWRCVASKISTPPAR